MDRRTCATCGRSIQRPDTHICASPQGEAAEGWPSTARVPWLVWTMALVLVVGVAVWWLTHRPDSSLPVGSAGATSRTCWDSSTVSGGGRCPALAGREALFKAFPIDPSTCVEDPSRMAPHNMWAMWCDQGDYTVHLATYVDSEARATRLAKYGPCSDTGRGRIFCPSTDLNPRSVRTYSDPRLLVYLSMDSGAVRAFKALPQTPAGDLLYGTGVGSSPQR